MHAGQLKPAGGARRKFDGIALGYYCILQNGTGKGRHGAGTGETLANGGVQLLQTDAKRLDVRSHAEGGNANK